MLNGQFNLTPVLQGCRQGNRNSQRQLYEHFYGYAMSICLRYAKHRDEAAEILNDAFFKVFSKLDSYDPSQPFRGWLRRILINSAIDWHRKNRHLPVHLDLAAANGVQGDEMEMPQLSPGEDALPIVQQLSPAYRVVFNLFVMEGFKHEEIAEMLGISVSTSRSNLVRAKEMLRALMSKKNIDTVKMN